MQSSHFLWRFIPTPVGNTRSTVAILSPVSVHPHACGEHPCAVVSPAANAGSSPRLWGTQSPAPSVSIRQRFIPTPVGNTNRWPFSGQDPAVHPHACGEHGPSKRNPISASVHPHACGEHLRNPERRRVQYGSSPRLWGTLL